jgi:hypothetical protein
MKISIVALILISCVAALPSTVSAKLRSVREGSSLMCDTIAPAGEVQIVVDSSITKLEKSMRGFRDIKGFRVQIFLGTAEAVKNERNKYLALGLPYSAYMKQVVPEYSLVIGDFSTRMELEKHLQTIQQHYPKAFAVNDMIEIKMKK